MSKPTKKTGKAQPRKKALKASKTKKQAAPTRDSGRCSWAAKDPLYIDYHDNEWGIPQADDRILFEKLILEGFQAGLSWITILRKREDFRKAFHNFDPAKIARYGKRDIARLMKDEGIVRNRRKIEATIDNAKAYLELTKQQSLASFIWGFLPDGPIIHRRRSMKEVPGQTELSVAISKALKNQGFRFVGPTTVYAFMQSMGMVNDHVTNCPRHKACSQAQRKFKIPARS